MKKVCPELRLEWQRWLQEGTLGIPGGFEIFGIGCTSQTGGGGKCLQRNATFQTLTGYHKCVEVSPMYSDKFSVLEVAELRSELIQSGLDARDAAELMQSFLQGGAMGFPWRRREQRRLRWRARAARWK